MKTAEALKLFAEGSISMEFPSSQPGRCGAGFSRRELSASTLLCLKPPFCRGSTQQAASRQQNPANICIYTWFKVLGCCSLIKKIKIKKVSSESKLKMQAMPPANCVPLNSQPSQPSHVHSKGISREEKQSLRSWERKRSFLDIPFATEIVT